MTMEPYREPQTLDEFIELDKPVGCLFCTQNDAGSLARWLREAIRRLELAKTENSRLRNLIYEKSYCPYCGNDVDYDVCHCGIGRESHEFEGHRFVPAGCTCGG